MAITSCGSNGVDTGGNASTLDTLVSVTGNLKIGNFTLSFTDLSIPVSGIPITLSRTYDSLTAGQPGRVRLTAGGWRSATPTCGPAWPRLAWKKS